jgi:hypothetical protein
MNNADMASDRAPDIGPGAPTSLANPALEDISAGTGVLLIALSTSRSGPAVADAQ